MGVTDIFDPRQNIMGGARYLQVLARRFCRTPAAAGRRTATGAVTVCSTDEKVKMIAGYHAGPGGGRKVRRHAPLRDDARLRGDGAAPLRPVPDRRRERRPRNERRPRAGAVAVAHLASAGELVAAKKFGEAEGEILRALSARPPMPRR